MQNNLSINFRLSILCIIPLMSLNNGFDCHNMILVIVFPELRNIKFLYQAKLFFFANFEVLEFLYGK